MEPKDFFRFLISGLSLTLAVVSGNDGFFQRECKTGPDVPVIKVTSYTVTVPLEDPVTNHVIFSSFSMARRRLAKESRPVRNETEVKVDICLGEGGLREWSVPVSNRTSFVSEVVIECFDQGLGPVEFEYNGIGNFQVGDSDDMNAVSNSSQYKHLYMPTSYKLVFKNISDQISGNYSCRSLERPERVNFFQLYVPMGGKPFLVQRGKTINVTQDRGSPLVTLPCIANNPSARIFLFKKFIVARMGIVIVKYQHQPFHIYDAKTGFVINTSDAGVDPYGTYICTSNPDIRDPTDRIRINLLAPEGASRKVDGHNSPSLFHIGSQFMRDSYRRLREIVNAFFI
jgi:hypothetical protein